MNSTNIADKLIGEKITIRLQEIGKQIPEEFNGIVTDVETNMISLDYFHQNYQKNCQGGFLFAGSTQGIFQIKNNQGKILYQNNSVSEKYRISKPIKNEKNREEIRKAGKYFIN